MLLTLLIGCFALVINMTIQVVAIVIILTFLLRNLEKYQLKSRYRTEIRVLGILVLALFAGHLLQFAIWANCSSNWANLPTSNWLFTIPW